MTFDDSLQQFVEFIFTKLGNSVAIESLFLRDPKGKLTCVVSAEKLDWNQREKLSKEAASIFHPYVEDDGFAISTAEELFDEQLASSTIGIITPLTINNREIFVRLLDRRVMGGAWLENQTEISTSRRLVFASLKGGVGRSTALCVLAADLANSGHRVLAIDMDVEAPGIGSMLLTNNTLPKFGLLDYLVESSLQELDENFYADLIAPSWLMNGRGIVSVIPAIGQSSIENPQNILSKIARAYLNGSNEEAVGVTNKMRDLLDRLDKSEAYDVILLDARAGLHETTGSALVGLGARIVLFGTDQKQTETGFEILFSNLAIVQKNGWQDRLVIVHAKSTANPSQRKYFGQRMQDSFSKIFTLQQDTQSKLNDEKYVSALNALDGVFAVEWEDSDSTNEAKTRDILSEENRPIEVAAILESEGYRDFDPLEEPDTLTAVVYKSIYGDFLSKAKALLTLPAELANE